MLLCCCEKRKVTVNIRVALLGKWAANAKHAIPNPTTPKIPNSSEGELDGVD